MVIRDHQLHPGEPAGPEGLQERGRERPAFAVADLDAQDFPVAGGGHSGRDDHGPRHPPAVHAVFDVGGIGEHVGELDMVQRAASGGVQVGVELLADPRYLGLRDARGNPESGDEVVNLADRHTMDPGLHHHCVEGPVDPPTPLQQRREERPGPQLRDLQLQVTGLGCEQAWAVPVALRGALITSFEAAGADLLGGLRLDQLLHDPPQARADGVGPLSGAERVEEVGQVKLLMGHWRDLLEVSLG